MATPIDLTPTSPTLSDAYALFRLERQGNLVTPATLDHYDRWVHHLFDWLRAEHPQVVTVADLDVNVLRAYRAMFAVQGRPDGRPRSPATMHASHRSIGAFLRWADADGLGVDSRILRLKAPRMPTMEKTVFTFTQFQAILAACETPTEAITVRLLVGSGMRASEAAGVCLRPLTGSRT